MITPATLFLKSIFLAPVFLAFLGTLPVVVLLYLLKLRRTEVVVPSTMLWRKSLQDLTANAPFQRLRKNLLLLLQLLILLLLALALARPFVRAWGTQGNRLCVFIDCSASMQTMEKGTSRMDLAKTKTREMVERLRGGDKMMLVRFSDRAEVLCEFTDDKYRLRNAIDSLRATDSATKIRDAMLVARSLKRGGSGATTDRLSPGSMGEAPDFNVVVVSDGKIADLDDIGANDLAITFLAVGETPKNAGIVAFSEREPADGKGQRQSFVLVHNEDDQPLESTLSLYFNDQLLSVEEVKVPPKGDGEVLFAHDDLGEGILRAVLDQEDALSVDNNAYLSLRPPTFLNVLLVSKTESVSAFYLKRALMLEKRVKLSAIAPESFSGTAGFDLVLFDNFAPPTLPPGNLVFINVVPPIEGMTLQGTLENPRIISKDSEHPVMRFLNPATVGIGRSQRMALPKGARVLLSAEEAPLVADISRGDQQILLITFDLADSNWPWQLSFPLFMQNIVSWAPHTGTEEEKSIATGSAITLLPIPGMDTATVTRPDKSTEKITLDPSRPTAYGRTDQAGTYTVTRGEMMEKYAVNLASLNESAITPAIGLQLGREEVKAVHGRIEQNRELWHWFVLAGLLFLGIEWWIYCRRAWM